MKTITSKKVKNYLNSRPVKSWPYSVYTDFQDRTDWIILDKQVELNIFKVTKQKDCPFWRFDFTVLSKNGNSILDENYCFLSKKDFQLIAAAILKENVKIIKNEPKISLDRYDRKRLFPERNGLTLCL